MQLQRHHTWNVSTEYATASLWPSGCQCRDVAVRFTGFGSRNTAATTSSDHSQRVWSVLSAHAPGHSPRETHAHNASKVTYQDPWRRAAPMRSPSLRPQSTPRRCPLCCFAWCTSPPRRPTPSPTTCTCSPVDLQHFNRRWPINNETMREIIA